MTASGVRLLLSACLTSLLAATAFSYDGEKACQVQCVRLAQMAPKSVFKGKVAYSMTAILSFEENGTIKKILDPGASFSSEVKRMDGTVLRKGDVVAQLDTCVAETNLRINSTKLKAAENNMNKAEDDYTRDKVLYEKQALSKANFKHSESSYISAQLSYSEAQLALELAQRTLDICTLRAPFDGEVEDIYYSQGSAVDHGKPVVKLVSLSPMKIVVKLPPSLTRRLDRTVKTLVYSTDPAKEPQVAWFTKSSVRTDSLECYVANPVCDVGESPETKGLPVVRSLCIVSQLSGTESIAPFWVLPDAIVKEGESFCVWRAKGVHVGDVNAPVTRVLTLERLEVTPGNQEMVQGLFTLRGIEKGPLSRNDILVSNPPEGLKDGCKAAYLEQRRLFRNGEDVLVKFAPDLGSPGFYVPRESVVDGRILELEDGKLKALAVKLVDECNDMVRIESPSLKEGMIVAIPDRYPALYEGRAVRDDEIRVNAIDLDEGKMKRDDSMDSPSAKNSRK